MMSNFDNKKTPTHLGKRFDEADFSLPDIANLVSIWIWVAGVNDKLIDARDPCCAADGGNNRFVWADLRLFDKATREERA